MLIFEQNILPTVSIIKDVLSRSYSEPPNEYSPTPFYGFGSYADMTTHKDLKAYIENFINDTSDDDFSMMRKAPTIKIPSNLVDLAKAYTGYLKDLEDFEESDEYVIEDEDNGNHASERALGGYKLCTCIEEMNVLYLANYIDNMIYRSRVNKSTEVNRAKTIDMYTLNPIYDEEEDSVVDAYQIAEDEPDDAPLTPTEYEELKRETCFLFFALQSEGYRYGVNTITYIINYAKGSAAYEKLKFANLYTDERMGTSNDSEFLPYNVNPESPYNVKKVTYHIAVGKTSGDPSRMMWDVFTGTDPKYSSFRSKIATFTNNCKRLGVNLSLEKTIDWVTPYTPKNVRALLPTNDIYDNVVKHALETLDTSGNGVKPAERIVSMDEILDTLTRYTFAQTHIIGGSNEKSGEITDFSDRYYEDSDDALNLAKRFLALMENHLSSHKEFSPYSTYDHYYIGLVDKVSFSEAGYLSCGDCPIYFQGSHLGKPESVTYVMHQSGYLVRFHADASKVVLKELSLVDIRKLIEAYMHNSNNFSTYEKISGVMSKCETGGFMS